MSTLVRAQRIEEIELAIAKIFQSPKAPTVSSYEEPSTVYLQLSWVVESNRDTTLDARCVVTLKFRPDSIDRYTALDTKQRRICQERIVALVKQRFDAEQNPPDLQGECAIELDVPDATFAVESDI